MNDSGLRARRPRHHKGRGADGFCFGEGAGMLGGGDLWVKIGVDLFHNPVPLRQRTDPIGIAKFKRLTAHITAIVTTWIGPHYFLTIPSLSENAKAQIYTLMCHIYSKIILQGFD